ncbi:ATP-binding cassette domain-containing protein [Streptomyces sp. NPDC046197]|uniref:ABC transporter ATP-binding protein n=1 Tax=Streptomyces sp. NPDC046197 TaxID=3154337 RepID=UPI0033E5B92E
MPSSQSTLVIDSISKRYGDRLALDAMSFTVSPGEIFGFVGSNGAGKTTTMRIAIGLLAADSGVVRWGGRPVTRGTAADFGYMPEERGLYPKMTVADHLVYLARLHGHTPASAAEAMRHWTERLNIGQHRDRSIDALSLGNQQRVQLAAALVHDPALLILDEPFSGLDPLAVADMSSVLKEKAADGVPILFSSHQLDLVERLCHRVGVAREGRLAACGTVRQLRAAGPRTIYLEMTEAGPDWPDRLSGVADWWPDGRGCVVRPEPDTDDQAILTGAMSLGRVSEFRRRQPSLTDLFLDLLGEPSADGKPATEGAR